MNKRRVDTSPRRFAVSGCFLDGYRTTCIGLVPNTDNDPTIRQGADKIPLNRHVRTNCDRAQHQRIPRNRMHLVF